MAHLHIITSSFRWFFWQTGSFHRIKRVKTMVQRNNLQKLMKAFGARGWGMAGLQPQPPGVAEVTSVIMGYVHCRYNVAVGRALPSASKSGAQGLEPKTPGEVSNAWGRQVQCQSPSSPPVTQASGSESPTTQKDSFQLVLEQRLRTVCPASLGIWQKEHSTAHELLGRHPKQNKKSKPF